MIKQAVRFHVPNVPTLLSVGLLLGILGAPEETRAQPFDLGFAGPPSISGGPCTVQVDQFLCTLTNVGGGPGAEAWSWGATVALISGVGDSCAKVAISGVTMAGTDADLAFAGGFQFHEVTPAGAALGAVALSQGLGASLPAGNAPASIAVLDVQATIPLSASPMPVIARLSYQNNLVGSGEPVKLEVSQSETAFDPTTSFLDFQLIRLIQFIRADADNSGLVTVNDGVTVLGHVMSLTPPVLPCDDAADADDNGVLTLADGINILRFAFEGTFAVPPPSPYLCGFDPTVDGLGCNRYDHCPGTALPPFLTVVPDSTVFPPGGLVTGVVNLSNADDLTGTLRVVANDRDAPQDPAFFDSFFDIVPGGERTFPFAYDGAPGVHLIAAGLVTNDAFEPTATARVGVRDPIPGVSTEVLRLQRDILNVAELREQIRANAETGEPTTLRVGETEVSLLLRRANVFDELDEGAEPPVGLANAATYEGTVVGMDNSLAVLTIGDPETDAMDDLFAVVSEDLADEHVMYIEPIVSEDGVREAGVHQCYFAQDVVIPPGELNHGDPESNPEDEKGELPAPEVDGPIIRGDGGGGSHLHVDKVVRIRVYEHFVSWSRTTRRCNLIYWWRAIAKNQFKNIVPRANSAYNLTVQNVYLVWWQMIPDANYAGKSCSGVLSQFRSDYDTVNHRLYVLFSTHGSGCGGIAYLGQGTRTRWHSLTKDTHSFHRDEAILGQEIGHNLDWHSTWSGPPHDAHLCSCISEIWNVFHGWWIFGYTHQHCTIMRGSYGGCDYVEWKYRRYSGTGLRHLAEGVFRTF